MFLCYEDIIWILIADISIVGIDSARCIRIMRSFRHLFIFFHHTSLNLFLYFAKSLRRLHLHGVIVTAGVGASSNWVDICGARLV